MAANGVIKNANFFLNGNSFAGQLVNVEPPKLTLTTEEFRAGGMNGPVELTTGHEALVFAAEIINFSAPVFQMFSLAEGANFSAHVRAAAEDWNGKITPIRWEMRGKIKELDPQTITPGTSAKMKISMALDYYRLLHDNREIIEIDVMNMTQMINGVDVLYGVASALGIR